MAGIEVDVMNSEPEEVDLMGDDMTMDDGNVENLPTPVPKLKSTIRDRTSRLGDGGPENTKSSLEKKQTVNAIATLQREGRNSKLPNYFVMGGRVSL
jgi:hypothetical protein